MRAPSPPILLLLAGLAGCVAPAPDGPVPVYDPGGDDFWATPWPSDRRLDDDGTLNLDGFPNPWNVPFLTDMLGLLDAQVGFGTSAPIFVPFEGPLDPERLPTPSESVLDGSSLLLVDIDPSSPTWGERVPVQWRVNADESVYQPLHLLAVAPLAGFPLRPSTTYALLVTTDAASPSPRFAETWDPDHPEHDADLRHALFFQHLSTDDVAVATTFTTTDPLDELARVADFVQNDVAPPELDRELEWLDGWSEHTAWRTHYPSPVFTHGLRPFTSDGGGFQFREDGKPVLAWFDDMRLAVCTPSDLSSPPPGGWPVVIYQHGTGGDYRGFCDSNGSFEVGRRLARHGFVGLGLDQPLHGNRDDGRSVSDLAHFNIVNPESGTTNFRQGAVDAIYLARALANAPVTFRTPEGEEIPLDPEQVFFMGHSQGALTGALAAPFLGHDVKAAVLSAGGGVLSITMVERKDIIDLAEMIRILLQFEEEEPLTIFHPGLALMQTLVEKTDPVNYAPYWSSQQGSWAGHAPLPVLLTSGTLDEMTPYKTAIALAAAARLPQLAPAATSTEALRLRGTEPVPLPQRDNAVGFDGLVQTAGFAQYDGGDHFVVFRIEEAADLYVNYLRTTADGAPFLWDLLEEEEE